MLPEFPDLSAPPTFGVSWPASIVSGFNLVASKYKQSVATLELDDGNLGRLRSLCRSVEQDLLPLWCQLESSGLPDDLVEEGLDRLAALFICLEESVEALEDRQVLKFIFDFTSSS